LRTNTRINILFYTLIIAILSIGLYSISNSTSQAAPTRQYNNRPGDYYYSVCNGEFINRSCVAEFGTNLDIDTGLEETVWSGGGPYVPPTQPRIHGLSSDNVLDSLVGTGARLVLIQGLDEKGVQFAEVITMDGISIVSPTTKIIHIKSMTVISSGANVFNEGNISAIADVDNTLSSLIPIGKNVSSAAIFQVPADHIFCLSNLTTVVNKGAGTSQVTFLIGVDAPSLLMPGTDIIGLDLLTSTSLNVPMIKMGVIGLDSSASAALQVDFKLPKCFPEMVLLQIQAIGSDPNVEVSAGIQGIIQCLDNCN